jgi:hypothetical protein
MTFMRFLVSLVSFLGSIVIFGLTVFFAVLMFMR